MCVRFPPTNHEPGGTDPSFFRFCGPVDPFFMDGGGPPQILDRAPKKIIQTTKRKRVNPGLGGGGVFFLFPTTFLLEISSFLSDISVPRGMGGPLNFNLLPLLLRPPRSFTSHYSTTTRIMTPDNHHRRRAVFAAAPTALIMMMLHLLLYHHHQGGIHPPRLYYFSNRNWLR